MHPQGVDSGGCLADDGQVKKFPLVCALSASALLLSSAIAFAAGVPVTPAPKETVDSPQPTFTWTVPAGEKVSDILISENNRQHRGILDQAIDDGQVRGKTSYHYTASILTPGDYYWQLSGLDADGNPAVSKVQHFVVPAVIQFSAVHARWSPHFDNGRPVDYFVATIRCNLDNKPTVVMKVYQGHQVLRTESFVGHDCVDMKPYAFADTYQKPITMPKGTRLTMRFFVKYDGYTAKSAVAPFSAH
jgi:hypothetical protein